MTDLEACRLIDTELESYYQEALEHGLVIPVISMLNFRKSLECICIKLLKHSEIDFSKDTLLKKIQKLSNQKIINVCTTDNLHKLRKQTNEYTHHSESGKGITAEELEDYRKVFLAVVLDAFQLLRQQEVVLSETPFETRKEEDVLYKAVNSLQWEDHYRAGHVYLKNSFKALKHIKDLDKSADENDLDKHQMLMRCAMCSFESAFMLSANVTTASLKSRLKNGEDIAKLLYCEKLKICDLESLYQFSFCSIRLSTDKDIINRAICLLEQAVERGHIEAIAFLGHYYLDNGKSVKALPLLKKAASEGNELGIIGMYQYHSDIEESKRDLTLINYYIGLLRELDTSKSTAILGSAYFNGIGVDQDQEYGLQLVEEAIENGETGAYTLAREMKFMLVIKACENVVDKKVTPPVQGRNDPCACGSGKKYKKCCMH